MAITEFQTDTEIPVATVISVRKLSGKHTVYDVEVTNRHRFYANDLLVHNCLGRYHPHSDVGVEGAMATMVMSACCLIDGVGNWGTLIDPPAAARYTEAVLSRYGDTFFGRDYLAVTEMVPNYDKKDKEPLCLPALLPNLFFNGSYGIGVGIQGSFPTFTPPSVLGVMVSLLDGEKLTVKDYAKRLEFFEPWGSKVVKSKTNRAAIERFLEGTTGSVLYSSEVKVNKDAKQIILDSFTPGVKIETLVSKIQACPEVEYVTQGKGLSFIIQVKKSINYTEYDALVAKIEKMTTTSQSYSLYVTERLPGKTEDDYKVKFYAETIPNLMVKWLKWRIALEVKSLTLQVANQEAAIAYTKLLIYACDCLDTIFKALRSPDPRAHLVKHMKITEAQADQILDLKVRQLSKLDQDSLKDKLKEQQEYLKELQGKLKRPKATVKAFLQKAAEAFKLVRHHNTPQFHYWALGKPKVERAS